MINLEWLAGMPRTALHLLTATLILLPLLFQSVLLLAAGARSALRPQWSGRVTERGLQLYALAHAALLWPLVSLDTDADALPRWIMHSRMLLVAPMVLAVMWMFASPLPPEHTRRTSTAPRPSPDREREPPAREPPSEREQA